MNNTDELTALKLLARGRSVTVVEAATGLNRTAVELIRKSAGGDLQARIDQLQNEGAPRIPKRDPEPARPRRLAVVDGRTKTCSKCKVEKPAAKFYRDPRNTKTTLSSQCKECMAASPSQAKGYDDSRAVRSRARARAQAKLRKTYPAEFEAMYQAELVLARAELDDIKAAAPKPKVDDHGHQVKAPPTPLLKPGTRNQGESVLDRIRQDVGTCPTCITSHDRGHTCPACGTAPTETRTG